MSQFLFHESKIILMFETGTKGEGEKSRISKKHIDSKYSQMEVIYYGDHELHSSSGEKYG